MKEPEETPLLFGKPLETLVIDDPEKIMLSKLDLQPVGNGICYLCAHPRAPVIGRIKSHGGLICYGCGIQHLV